MKKLLLILLTPIIFLTSCSKSGITPQTMEETIIGKKWWHIVDEEGILLTEEGDLYYLQLCQQDSLMGNWIIDEDLIKLRFYENSIEYTALIGEVTAYTDSELKIKVETNDTNLQANYVFTTDFVEVFGCTDASADNYNEDANCDNGSCNYCISNECTFVPDDSFEQQLIDLGYDDILDNYVLTENINQTINLSLMIGYSFDDLGENPQIAIQDLTGLEDFISLQNLYLSVRDYQEIIDLSNLPSLLTLTTSYESRGNIKVHNPNLISIYGPGSFDIAGATSLTSFSSFYFGPQQEFDFSNNLALESLYLSDGQLNFLDLSNNTNLTRLHLYQVNPLECIQVHNVDWANNIPDLNLEWQHYFSEDCSAK